MDLAFLNHVCFLSEPGPIGDALECEGIQVSYLPLRGVCSLPWVVVRLTRLIWGTRYDILCLYGLKANILGRVLGKLCKREVILGALRSMYPSEINRRWVLWLDRLFFGLSTGYVSNSQAAIDFLVAHGFDRRKFWLIHNGIDLNEFRPSPDTGQTNPRQRLGISLNALVVTCVANLRPPKGHFYLIEAISQTQWKQLNLKLLLVGDGPLREDLEAFARKYHISEAIAFLGAVDRRTVLDVLRITDIFVLPSLNEGLPTAVLEAMAAGCPVVATAVGGMPELVVHNETGLLIPPRDPVALAKALPLLAENEETRKRMGTASKKRVQQFFSIDRMVQEYESLYVQMLETRKR